MLSSVHLRTGFPQPQRAVQHSLAPRKSCAHRVSVRVYAAQTEAHDDEVSPSWETRGKAAMLSTTTPCAESISTAPSACQFPCTSPTMQSPNKPVCPSFCCRAGWHTTEMPCTSTEPCKVGHLSIVLLCPCPLRVNPAPAPPISYSHLSSPPSSHTNFCSAHGPPSTPRMRGAYVQ